ncbi:SAF domain protein [Ammonifex degensii KC4]|uniref:SAF domain protein n=1 Tax=Ammonifex degensii (strain DSM 10501 / KC4) TaxID=429009 RepID=C9RCE4_AMMDK|nr:RcpC/CpaB family pilus assembly protein [Ammonifex degensii]ACX51921.1 SAF domain protein [Ammonifex degensii KC4]
MTRQKFFFLMAVLAGLVAAGSLAWLLSAFLPQKTVLVAKSDVPARGPVTEVEAVSLPKAGLPPDAVTERGELAGKVARGFIPAGTVLRRAMLQPKWAAGAAGALAEIGPGYRMLALPLTADTTVGGCVASGDRIDVYLVRGGRAELVAADVLVFSGPGVPSREGKKGFGALTGGDREQEKRDSLVVVVRPDEAERLVSALGGDGKLVAVLRPLD